MQGFVHAVWHVVSQCRQKSQQLSHSCKNLKLSPSEVLEGEIKSLGKHYAGVPEFSQWLTGLPVKTKPGLDFIFFSLGPSWLVMTCTVRYTGEEIRHSSWSSVGLCAILITLLFINKKRKNTFRGFLLWSGRGSRMWSWWGPGWG